MAARAFVPYKISETDKDAIKYVQAKAGVLDFLDTNVHLLI